MGFSNNTTKALYKIIPIAIVFKDRFSLYSADDDMVQGTGASILALRGIALIYPNTKMMYIDK